MFTNGSRIETFFSRSFTDFKYKKELVLFLVFSCVAAYWFRGFWSRTNFQSFDWIKENFYFSVLRDSLAKGQFIPQSLGDIPEQLEYFPALQSTSSYLGNPETLALNPFMALVLLPTELFFKFFFAAHLGIAILGIVLISRKLNWSGLTSAVLFVGFILSPWMMQHLVLGYTPWVQVYWLPLAANFLIRMKPVLSGLVLSIIFWSGGLHVYFWVILSLGLLIFLTLLTRQWLWLKNLFIASLVSLLLSGIRAVFIFSSLTHNLVSRDIAGSYSSLSDVYGLLTDGHTNPFTVENPYAIYGTSFYDSSFYIGWYGLLLFVATIVFSAFLLDFKFWIIGISGIATFFVLGWNGVWRIVYQIFPIIGASEVYPFRFLPVAMAWGLVIGLVALNRITFKYSNREFYLFLAALLLPLLVEFYQRNTFFLLEVLPQR